MPKLKIIAYLKPYCGWSNGVRAILEKHNLEYEDRDVINNQQNYQEMVEKSGQSFSPCVEINGKMLADVSGDEVEEYLIENKLVERVDKKLNVKTGSGCDHEMHQDTIDATEMKFR